MNHTPCELVDGLDILARVGVSGVGTFTEGIRVLKMSCMGVSVRSVSRLHILLGFTTSVTFADVWF
jgi:hypothetical protein